jgi:hypothetical protein
VSGFNADSYAVGPAGDAHTYPYSSLYHQAYTYADTAAGGRSHPNANPY